MKRQTKSTLEQELRSLSDSSEVDGLLDFANSLKAEAPTLSKKQKKQMLRDILPEDQKKGLRSYSYTFATAFAIVVTSFIVTPHVSRSQPGDPLYRVKQGVESVRNLVQPNYVTTDERNKDSDKEDDHLEDDSRGKLEDQNDDSSKNKGSGSVEDSNDDSDDNSGRSSRSSQSQEDADDDSSVDDDHNDSEDDHSARDACKDALDDRKDNGENITSDMYKACDNL